MLLLRLLNSLLQRQRPRRNLVRENLKRSINIQQQVAEFAVTALRLMMDKEKGSSKGFGYVHSNLATTGGSCEHPTAATVSPPIAANRMHRMS
ncbi:hypothetical protein pipiens_006409 [Culex pipiens pipiens]|uniref:Uncharacterized protein n=1 Tax=Culex pipiens pipiens TaxID=38569 RepID=A0ABD1DQD9_CULPP